MGETNEECEESGRWERQMKSAKRVEERSNTQAHDT